MTPGAARTTSSRTVTPSTPCIPAYSARPRLATAPLHLHQRVGSPLDLVFAFEGLGIMR